MRRVLALVLLAAAQAAAQTMAQPTPEAVVRAHVEAFNRQDAAALAAAVTPDFAWFNVKGDTQEVQARGREALERGMESYFKSLPSARSRIESLSVNGNFVSVKERATWKNKAGEDRGQSALAVYEVEGALIARVWYFPAQK